MDCYSVLRTVEFVPPALVSVSGDWVVHVGTNLVALYFSPCVPLACSCLVLLLKAHLNTC